MLSIDSTDQSGGLYHQEILGQAISIFIIPIPLKIPNLTANIVTFGRDREVINC